MANKKLTKAEKQQRAEARRAKASAEKRERKLQKESITPREAAYIKERLKPGVGRGEAAQRAGLKTVPRRPQVERTVRSLVKRQMNLANVGAVEVLHEVKRLAMVDIGNTESNEGTILSFAEMDEDTRRAIVGTKVREVFEMVMNAEGKMERELSGYVVEVKTDKTKALEMLMKHFGLMSGEGKKGGDRLAEVVACMDHGPVQV